MPVLVIYDIKKVLSIEVRQILLGLLELWFSTLAHDGFLVKLFMKTKEDPSPLEPNSSVMFGFLL